MPTPTADLFCGTWATILSATGSSPIWCTMCAAAISSRRCYRTRPTSTSMLLPSARCLIILHSSDNSGHPTINRVVALEFPKLKKKYGDNVAYANDPKAHIRTEFGFDMVQVAKNHYTSDRYHDMVGFEVSKLLLERAFVDTYGLKLEDVFGSVDLAIGSYRRSVSTLIPEMTRVALLSRHDVIVKDTPNFNRKKFLYNLSRSNYEHEWGTIYRKPGIGSRILAFFLRLIPKVGPFKAVNFKIPTQQTEDMYIKSVNDTVENYGHLLSQAGSEKIELPNRDCDTGRETRAGEYALTDNSYAHLIDQLASKSSDPIDPALRENLLQFYADPNAPVATRKNAKAWRQLQDQLQQLKQRAAAPPNNPRPESVNCPGTVPTCYPRAHSGTL